MRQLNYISAGRVEWLDVAAPTLEDDASALVRPVAVSTCDFDGLALRGLARMRGPVPLGHEGVARVVEVGDRVARVQIGDLVIVPWKIACGSCVPCRRGFTSQCESVPPEDAYGWGPTSPKRGGFYSDLVRVPYADFMLHPLPPGVDPVAASGTADNITDAWRAVGPQLAARPGGTVLVACAAPPGSIPLYAAALALAAGASRVVYADPDAGRREIARAFGAETVALGEALALADIAGSFDITVDATGDPAAVAALVRKTGPGGACTSTAAMLYRSADVPVPLYDMQRRAITLSAGWVHTHVLLDGPLALIANGRFDPACIAPRVVAWDDLEDALTQDFVKVVGVR